MVNEFNKYDSRDCCRAYFLNALTYRSAVFAVLFIHGNDRKSAEEIYLICTKRTGIYNMKVNW